MENCKKCGDRLSEDDVEFCSKCTENEEQQEDSIDIQELEEANEDNTLSEDNEDEVDKDVNTSDGESDKSEADKPNEEPVNDDDMSDRAALVALTMKEKHKRLFVTLAAAIVIIGLIVALVVVLVAPGTDDTPSMIGSGETVDAAELLEVLRNYDGDDFTAFFTDMMFEFSEDPGLLTAPGGYLFGEGVMVEEFFNAAAALEIGEMSDLVETVHGFHIIYRVPIDPDATLSGTQESLRMLYSMDVLHTMIEDWIDTLEYEFTEEYNSINLVEMFSTVSAPVEETEEAELEPEVATDEEAETETEPEAEAETESEVEPEAEAENDVETQGELRLSDIDTQALFETFEPNTPMIIAGEEIIMWEELFSMIYFWVGSLDENFGYIPDLSQPLGDDTRPLHEIVMELATEETTNRLSFWHNAEVLNISFTEEDYQFLDESLAMLIQQHGGEDEFMNILWERFGIRNLDLYRQIQATSHLYIVILQELERGDIFPIEDIIRRAEEDGIIMAKHILIRHPQPEPDSP